VREDRPALELEPPPTGVVDDQVGADDIRGHQVRRELHPREGQLQRLGQRAHQQRLAETRDPFDEHVTAREQRGHHRRRDLGLTDQAAPDLRQQPIQVGPEGRRGRAGALGPRRFGVVHLGLRGRMRSK